MNSKVPFSVLVLAIAAAPAMAQSSFQIGGRVDVGPQLIDNGVTRQKRLDSGNYTASRLSVSGVQDLGAGNSANIYLETRYNADTGTQQSSTKFFNAGAFVGLKSTTWGSITMGRQYVPMFWSFLWSDDTGPLRLHSYSAVQSIERGSFARLSAAASPAKSAGSLDTISGGVYTLSATSAFEDNLAIYKTPAFAGTTLSLAVGAPEGYAAGSGKIFSGDVEYNKNGIYASVAYNQKQGRVPAGGALEQKVTEELVAGMYPVTSQFKLWGNFHPWKFDTVGAQLKGHDWMLGTSYWFSNGELWLNYAAKTLESCVSCDSKGLGIGYHYFASKTVEIYGSYAIVDNDSNSGIALNGFAPGAFGKSVRGLAAGVAVVF